ncbi:hypothetical protein [Halocalculus aciditolerans]|uniref:Uncharacterized protein n=1 Tax=Halocalculus aciditolerans TaxID=1383812 RepID=A0A830FPT0_9EURY|nr:hypothetical protein [Halocalculus aciditolerans]GGL68398.1 hypothetical protein GCM10009039_28030 [Halocalculus aciditolerans]
MDASRRHALQVAGATALTALAGCSANSALDASEPETTYTLSTDSVDRSPIEHALYEPGDDALFGEPERTALDAILPDGRHTTYGYQPLPDDAYVEDDGTYYQTKHVVTGRERIERPLVRADPVPEQEIPADALSLDSLNRPSARVVKILHGHSQSGGRTAGDLLRGDAYVLRRPAELDSELASGDVDGRVVRLTEDGPWAYRLHVTRESLAETAYTAFALALTDSRTRFRDIVFASRIDTTLAPADLSAAARDDLTQAITEGTYRETAALSDGFGELLTALDLGRESTNGRLLWYQNRLYRYGLYVDDAK